MRSGRPRRAGRQQFNRRRIATPQRDRGSNSRSFADADKLALVKKADQSGVNGAARCRRRDTATGMIFSQGVQIDIGRVEAGKLAAASVADGQDCCGCDARDGVVILQKM